MITLDMIQQIVASVRYKDWHFGVYKNGTDMYVQITFEDACNIEPDTKYLNSCRKWRLSQYMTETEIVGTCFAAVKMAEEHELAEKFYYCDVLPFKHHTNIKDLVKLAKNSTPDKRG